MKIEINENEMYKIKEKLDNSKKFDKDNMIVNVYIYKDIFGNELGIVELRPDYIKIEIQEVELHETFLFKDCIDFMNTLQSIIYDVKRKPIKRMKQSPLSKWMD